MEGFCWICFFLVCFGCFQLCFSLKNHTKPNKTPTQKRQPKSCGSALKILQIKGSPGQRGPKEQGRAPSTETPSPTDVSGWLSMSPRAWWPPRVSPRGWSSAGTKDHLGHTNLYVRIPNKPRRYQENSQLINSIYSALQQTH